MSVGELVRSTVASPPVAEATGPGQDDGLTPEATAALIAYAKDVIAGRIQPPPLRSLEAEEFLRQEFAGYEPPSAEAVRAISERDYLEKRYQGEPVVCFTTRAGTMAVLACGEPEIIALLDGLTAEERSKAAITDTWSFGSLGLKL